MLVRYCINNTERFDESHYPVIAREISDLYRSLFKITSDHKISIIISLLKEHSIKTAWLDGNGELTKLLTSGILPTSHLESLFEASKDNPKFQNDLETYIAAKFS